jgi:hypothetical protein
MPRGEALKRVERAMTEADRFREYAENAAAAKGLTPLPETEREIEVI